MKVCPTCGRKKPQHDLKEISCPKCKEVYTEEADLPPVRLSDEDLDKLAKRVLKSFDEEHFDRLAALTLQKFTKGDWKGLANQVWKSLNLVYHGKQVGTMLLGTWQFWSLFALIAIIAAFGAFKLAPDAAREKATSLFNATVTNEIKLQFREPRISNIVVSTASSEATNVLLSQIYPTIERFENTVSNRIGHFNDSLRDSETTISNLDSIVAEAKEAVKRLDQDSEFVIKAILADHDSRSAYEQLRRWGMDPAFRHKQTARAVSDLVQGSYVSDMRAWQKSPWSELDQTTNRAVWSIDLINEFWNGLATGQARDFLGFVWGNTNLAKEQRLAFLHRTYLHDSRDSLQAANYAAATVATELGVDYLTRPFFYSSLEFRWAEYITTNHLFAIPPSGETNIVYEILLSTTNQIQTVRDWGAAKLVLFKLKGVPKPGTLQIMGINYSNIWLNKLQFWSPPYRNTVLSAIADNLQKDTKYEFRYEPDPSTTNIQSVTVTSNALIFDGSVEIRIPP
jgi:hypothetical protein